MKAESGAMGHVAVPKLTSTGAERHVAVSELTSEQRRGPEPWDTWWRQSPPLQGGVIRRYSLCDNTWMHALLLVLAWRLYTGVSDLQGTDSRASGRPTLTC
jgi:hypothetical protein